MLLPNVSPHLNGIEDAKLKEALGRLNSDIATRINGNLNFGTPQDQNVGQSGNINGSWPGTFVSPSSYMIQTPAGANVEFTVTHNLGRVPTGYDVKSQDAAGIVYDSRRVNWTKTQMFLKCSVASMNIIIFVH